MKNNTLLTIFSFALAIAISACGGKKTDATAAKKAELAELKRQQTELNGKISALEKELGVSLNKDAKTKTVSVLPLAATPFNHFLELQGSVVADDEVYLNSKMPGLITKVYLKVGDKVQAGQTVAEIDDNMVRQGMNELQVRLKLARDLFMKQESLWKQGIGSEVQYLTAKNNVEALEKTMNTLQTQQTDFLVKAPISGVVDEVMLKVGQATSPGIPLAKIVNFSKLKIHADVAETFASKVRAGNSVMVSFPDLKKDVSSKIGYVGNSVNPMNRTFKVEVPLKANEGGVIPNMVGIVKVTDYSNPNAIVILINMVQRDAEGDFVMIADNGKAKKARVKLGQIYNEQAEILSGLRLGDQIITVGYQDVTEGDAITIL